jgi:hypothetical protein
VIVSYRGHTISVERQKCMGGWSQLYFSVFRESDGYECLSSFEDSEEMLSDKVQQLRDRIDAELIEDDPWGEAAERDGFNGEAGNA